MKKILFLFFILFNISMFTVAAETNVSLVPVRELVKRILPEHYLKIVVEYMPDVTNDERFELYSQADKIIIRGTTKSAIGVGLNYYLKYYCKTYVSWYSFDKIETPKVLPVVPEKVVRSARVPERFFLNYCTYGYTLTWWGWHEWERLIDWMALNGINMPLAIAGQESVWLNVWKKYGLTEKQILEYFTGPSYLPWHRMSNIDYWMGPLPMSWIKNQEKLQKKILRRTRDLGMKPVLPAFAGHVPEILKEKYPKAKITPLSIWGDFEDQYRCHFLDPFDSLFTDIQKTYIDEQTKLYGTDHIYGVDPFNELAPPSWEPEYLANASAKIYDVLKNADSKAVWLQMTWMFSYQRKDWTDERIKSYITAVPDKKQILLDYYAERTEVWKFSESYYKQPFIWCYLGNFGGNTMIAGNIAEVDRRLNEAFANAESMVGVGSTLEGFDVNPIMYDFVFEKVWHKDGISLHDWTVQWAQRRVGTTDENAEKAWKLLIDKIYVQYSLCTEGTLTNARPSLTGHGNWTTKNWTKYNNRDLLEAWGLLLRSKAITKIAYKYDIVNIGRQVLGNYFTVLRDEFTQAYERKDISALTIKGNEMLSLLNDLEALLYTSPSFLLGPWLTNAQNMGRNMEESRYYEKNARNIITNWSTQGVALNDYGNRTWAGLLQGYYTPRWKMFIEEVISAVKQNKEFNNETFFKKVTDEEWQWISKTENYPIQATGDSYLLANKFYHKYHHLINPDE